MAKSKGRKPAIELNNNEAGRRHRAMEKWSFSDTHQYDIEKRMKTGNKSPKGKPRSWREAAMYDAAPSKRRRKEG